MSGQGYGQPPQGYPQPGYPPQGYAPQGHAPATRPPPVKLSGGLYITMILLCYLAGGIIFFFASQPATKEALPAVPLPFLVLLIFQAVFAYKMYKAIHDGQTSPGPGAAAALLCIPLVSLIGMFVVWCKYPGQYNAFIQRHGLRVPPLSSGLYIATPILMLVFPFVGLILYAIVIGKTAGAVNALSRV